MTRRIPDTVAEKILKRCAQDEAAVVVPKNGRPSRVFSIGKYLKMKEQPKKHKPWNHRKAKQATLDPLGTAHWKGRMLLPLTRKNMYELDES